MESEGGEETETSGLISGGGGGGALSPSFLHQLTHYIELTAGLAKGYLPKMNLLPFCDEMELGKLDFRMRSWETEAMIPTHNHPCFFSHKYFIFMIR